MYIIEIIFRIKYCTHFVGINKMFIMIIGGILYLLIFGWLIFRFSLNTSEQCDIKLLTHKIYDW